MFSVVKVSLPPAPPWFWVSLTAIIAGGLLVSLLLWFGGSGLLGVEARAPVEESPAGLPVGCAALKVMMPEGTTAGEEVQLTFTRATISDMLECNPRQFWGSGVSVVDIARSGRRDGDGSLVKVRFRNGVAQLGIKDRNRSEGVVGLHCDHRDHAASELYTGKWGSVVPPSLRLDVVKPESIGEIGYLADVCDGQ
jgi:hypothetical protein